MQVLPKIVNGLNSEFSLKPFSLKVAFYVFDWNMLLKLLIFFDIALEIV